MQQLQCARDWIVTNIWDRNPNDDPGQAVDAINDTECAIHQVCATVGTQAQMDWEYLQKF